MEKPVVLVSDDDPLIVRAMDRQANRAGLWVIPDMSSNVQALARQLQPDLVVLDLNQKVDGRELLASLKEDPSTRGLPVVMMSSIDDEEARRQCLALGASDYFLKPVDARLLTRLAQLASDSQRSRLHSTGRAYASSASR